MERDDRSDGDRAQRLDLRSDAGPLASERRLLVEIGVVADVLRRGAGSSRSAAGLPYDAGPQPSTRRSFDSGASSPGKTFFTPSPSAFSMMRMSRTSEMKPLGSSDAAWSEPHMVRSSVM